MQSDERFLDKDLVISINHVENLQEDSKAQFKYLVNM